MNTPHWLYSSSSYASYFPMIIQVCRAYFSPNPKPIQKERKPLHHSIQLKHINDDLLLSQIATRIVWHSMDVDLIWIDKRTCSFHQFCSHYMYMNWCVFCAWWWCLSGMAVLYSTKRKNQNSNSYCCTLTNNLNCHIRNVFVNCIVWQLYNNLFVVNILWCVQIEQIMCTHCAQIYDYLNHCMNI